MGFHVSTLHNLPVDGIHHFVHVLDMSGGAHARWINENLHTLAASFGRDAGLVTGPRDLSEELYQFLSRNLPSDFGAVEGVLHSATCLIVSEGHFGCCLHKTLKDPLSKRSFAVGGFIPGDIPIELDKRLLRRGKATQGPPFVSTLIRLVVATTLSRRATPAQRLIKQIHKLIQ